MRDAPHPAPADSRQSHSWSDPPPRPACPACGGPLQEQRAKLVCTRCGTICETCCDGGRQ